MNDMQIYAQVAKKPRIGATEIATNLGLTLATVSADLRVLVDTGDLVKSTHFDEDNGRQWQVYELSEGFKASRTYKALMESLAPASAAESVLAKTGTKVDPVQPAAAPPTSPQLGPSVSKVQLALDCITKLGSATDDQLRDAMGLLPKTYVGAYLASAVKSGKVLRDGDRWKLGPGKVEAKVLDSVEKVGNIIVATKDASPIPQPVLDAITASPAMVGYRPLAPVADPVLRCSMWSDGTFELQRDGKTVVELTEAETTFVRRYLDRAPG